MIAELFEYTVISEEAEKGLRLMKVGLGFSYFSLVPSPPINPPQTRTHTRPKTELKDQTQWV